MRIELSENQVAVITAMLDHEIKKINQFPEILAHDAEAAIALRLIEDCREAFTLKMREAI
jgi:hypothetical protein